MTGWVGRHASAGSHLGGVRPASRPHPSCPGITISGQLRRDGHATKVRLHIWRTFIGLRLALGFFGVFGVSVAVQAQTLDDVKAREIIGPFYGLLTVATRGDVPATEERILALDYQSCSGNLPSECRDRETMIKVFEGFAKSTPDMRFDIKDVLVSGDRVVVRGELTGTPAGDLFGVPHTGKSFRIMTIDIQTIRDGRIAKSFHSENWLSALGQLRAE